MVKYKCLMETDGTETGTFFKLCLLVYAKQEPVLVLSLVLGYL